MSSSNCKHPLLSATPGPWTSATSTHAYTHTCAHACLLGFRLTPERCTITASSHRESWACSIPHDTQCWEGMSTCRQSQCPHHRLPSSCGLRGPSHGLCPGCARGLELGPSHEHLQSVTANTSDQWHSCITPMSYAHQDESDEQTAVELRKSPTFPAIWGGGGAWWSLIRSCHTLSSFCTRFKCIISSGLIHETAAERFADTDWLIFDRP